MVILRVRLVSFYLHIVFVLSILILASVICITTLNGSEFMKCSYTGICITEIEIHGKWRSSQLRTKPEIPRLSRDGLVQISIFLRLSLKLLKLVLN